MKPGDFLKIGSMVVIGEGINTTTFTAYSTMYMNFHAHTDRIEIPNGMTGICIEESLQPGFSTTVVYKILLDDGRCVWMHEFYLKEIT